MTAENGSSHNAFLLFLTAHSLQMKTESKLHTRVLLSFGLTLLFFPLNPSFLFFGGGRKTEEKKKENKKGKGKLKALQKGKFEGENICQKREKKNRKGSFLKCAEWKETFFFLKAPLTPPSLCHLCLLTDGSDSALYQEVAAGPFPSLGMGSLHTQHGTCAGHGGKWLLSGCHHSHSHQAPLLALLGHGRCDTR